MGGSAIETFIPGRPYLPIETVTPISHCLGWDIIRSSEDGPYYPIFGIKPCEMAPGLI